MGLRTLDKVLSGDHGFDRAVEEWRRNCFLEATPVLHRRRVVFAL